MSDTVIIAIIGGIVTLLSLIINKNVKQIHTIINSRMDELLALTRKEGKAEGKAEQIKSDKK